MTPQLIRDMLSRRPFDPFKVRLSNGEVYEVNHPEAAFLLRGGLYIALPTHNGDIPERAVYCAMLHIAAVESLSHAQ